MTGYVYAIGAEGTSRFKIGSSQDPEKRLRALQIGSPVRLRLVACARDLEGRFERELHSLFAPVHGEWFDLAGISESTLCEVFAALDLWADADESEQRLIVDLIGELAESRQVAA